MFKYSLDEKPQIRDPKGNQIVDLAKSMFARGSGFIQDYEVVKMSETFHMRPDLVSYAMYETEERAEYVLKYSGISNPFTLDDDDVLLIPNESQAEGMMAANNDDSIDQSATAVEMQIRNYFKFVNTEYKPDRTSYDNLKNMNIPSGIIDQRDLGGSYMVPYISEDGRTAVTVRGGRMYFGEDTGVESAATAAITADDMNKSVTEIINKTLTNLSDSNCIYNGTTLADFVRANINKNNNS